MNHRKSRSCGHMKLPSHKKHIPTIFSLSICGEKLTLWLNTHLQQCCFLYESTKTYAKSNKRKNIKWFICIEPLRKRTKTFSKKNKLEQVSQTKKMSIILHVYLYNFREIIFLWFELNRPTNSPQLFYFSGEGEFWNSHSM